MNNVDHTRPQSTGSPLTLSQWTEGTWFGMNLGSLPGLGLVMFGLLRTLANSATPGWLPWIGVALAMSHGIVASLLWYNRARVLAWSALQTMLWIGGAGGGLLSALFIQAAVPFELTMPTVAFTLGHLIVAVGLRYFTLRSLAAS